ncbi:MAG TPA: metallophosphoesterase [Candidatus Binatia bacterium]|nr:metallophosphoesterase [Candidatus Binatia bacterium]
MTTAGHVIFRRFWTTLAFGGAVGEWALWCWFFGAPSSVVAHALCLAGLFAMNRLAAEAFDRETHRAPLLSPVGGVVLGLGFMAFGGAAALGLAAAGWLVLDMLIAFPAEAGALVGPAGAHLGPGFELVAPFIIAAASGTVGYGYLVGHSRLRVTQLDVPIEGLPSALDGLRVVHISDLHLGPLAHLASLRAAFDRVAALEPDIVCLTGDIVDSPKADLDHWGPEMARLTARYGVFAILGNHDRVAGGDAVAAMIARHTSWELLRDRVASVTIDGAQLHVIGIEDRLVPQTPRVLSALRAEVPAGEPCILLIHQPGGFTLTSSSGIPLTLAGHTHGGQVAAPGVPKLNPARLLMTRFDGGTFERDGVVMHVNRGLGVSGQRIRVGVPREITVVTLRTHAAVKAA